MIKLTTILKEIQIKAIQYPKIGDRYKIEYLYNVREIEDIVEDKLFDGGKRIIFKNGTGDFSINEFLRGLKDGSIIKLNK